MSFWWATEEAYLIVVVTLHFEMLVSAFKVADLQRVDMLSSLGEFSILDFFIFPSSFIFVKVRSILFVVSLWYKKKLLALPV